MADTTNKYNFLDYEGLSLFWNNVKKVIEDNELVTATARRTSYASQVCMSISILYLSCRALQ